MSWKKHVQLRVLEVRPQGEPVADVMFFHGFGDRVDNHLPLFNTWAQNGIRTIGFDYPSHGLTRGHGIEINAIGMADLMDMALRLEVNKIEKNSRPLILAGWSTGGLLVARILQEGKFRVPGRVPSGAILLAPAVSPKFIVGEKGWVTEATLTRNTNPPHVAPPKPNMPMLQAPFFGLELMWNGKLANTTQYPPNIPMLVVLADDKMDKYTNTQATKTWTKRLQTAGFPVTGLQCPGAYHELDNETEPVAFSVKQATTLFALHSTSRANAVFNPFPMMGCHWF